MRHILLLFATSIAATLFATAASHAQYDAPWCAMQSLGNGSMVQRCVYRNLESCVPDVIAGNRGYCIQNPRLAYLGPAPGHTWKARRKHRHY
jgi:hypothetical protein